MIFNESITIDNEGIGQTVGAANVSRLALESGSFIDKLREGDAAAFDQFVERFSADVYALLYRLTGNGEDASDLTQDTFLRALRSIRKFRGDSELKTWVFRIAINESRNRFRWWKRRRRDLTISLDSTIGNSERTVGDSLAAQSRTPEEETLSAERKYAITSALSDIPSVYREAIVLCDIEGMSYEDTAASLGITLGTVKSRISRGREALRTRLKDF